MQKILIILIALIHSTSAGAYDFGFGNNDYSVQFLKSVFGDWGGNFYGPLADGFKVFNIFLMAVAALYFVFNFVVGILNSAHEGKVMGKRWNQIYTPMRFTVGIILLAPIAGGISLIQVILFSMVVAGTSLASAIWSGSITGVHAISGNVISAQIASTTEIKSMMQSILHAESCVTANNNLTANTGLTDYYERWEKDGFIHWGYKYYNYPICGKLELPKSDANNEILNSAIKGGAQATEEAKKLIIQGQIKGLNSAMHRLKYAAQKITAQCAEQRDYDRARCTRASISAPNTLDTDEIDAILLQAEKDYLSTSTYYIKAAIKNVGDPVLKGLEKDAKSNGWFLAGADYFAIANANSNIRNSSKWTGNVDGINDSKYLNNNQARELVDSITQQNFLSAALNSDNFIDSVVSKVPSINDFAKSVATIIGYDPNSNNHPIIQLKNTGDYMMGVAEGFTAALTAATVLTNTIEAIPVVGTGIGAILGALTKPPMSTILTGLLMGMLGFGAMLSIVTPLMPFIIWLWQIIKWAISVVELMIAAPIWVIQHMSPEGQGVFSDSSKGGFLVIVDVVLRPPLMIFGLIIATVLMRPAFDLLAGTYFTVFNSIQVNSTTGLITVIVSTMVYASLCLGLITLVFSAVSSIPNGVMRYLSGALSSGGLSGDTPATGGAGAAVALPVPVRAGSTGAAKGAAAGAAAKAAGGAGSAAAGKVSLGGVDAGAHIGKVASEPAK